MRLWESLVRSQNHLCLAWMDNKLDHCGHQEHWNHPHQYVHQSCIDAICRCQSLGSGLGSPLASLQQESKSVALSPFNINIRHSTSPCIIQHHNVPCFTRTPLVKYSWWSWADENSLWSPKKFPYSIWLFDFLDQDSAEELLAERDSMIRQLQETVLLQHHHHCYRYGFYWNDFFSMPSSS